MPYLYRCASQDGVEGVGVGRNAGMFVVLGSCLLVVVQSFDQVFRLAARQAFRLVGEGCGKVPDGKGSRVVDESVYGHMTHKMTARLFVCLSAI